MSIKDSELLLLYPEEYLVEEDEEAGSSDAQVFVSKYLIEVLEWLYHYANWYISRELVFLHPAIRNSQNKIVPDVFIFKDVDIPEPLRRTLTSWRISPPQHPAPKVVFEASSKDTWLNDIGSQDKQKPAIYGRIGVLEYFAYDPNPRPVWQNTGGRRLLGWRYHDGHAFPIVPDERGWLWSVELDSWLVEDGSLLRLYDRAGELRLTGREAEAEARRKMEQEMAELRRLLEQSGKKGRRPKPNP